MRYSIIVALDNNFALTNNFVENLLLTESLQNDSELVIVSDGCANIQTVKETIGVGVNEKAALSSDKNCPFVYINFDFTLVNKVASL